ncbi:MAG TPA: hypothetical protein VF608_07565 [Thermoanaerobaculia bacterium]
MARNCGTAIVLWILLAGGYGYFLRDRLPMPAMPIVAIVMATFVWMGLIVINGGRYALRDWHAQNRMARGERPADGQLVAAIGPIRPTLGALHSPLRGVECVAYTYKIGPPAQTSDSPAPDYAGFAITRCAVHTSYGAMHIGTFALFEGVEKAVGDRAHAMAYVESTKFETLEGFKELATSMFAMYTAPAPMRRDWRVGGEPRLPVSSADLEESVIRVGETVTAYGRYVAATNSIVSDIKDQGYLRITPGGEARRESSFPSNAIQKFIGGSVAIVASNALLWWVMRFIPLG